MTTDLGSASNAVKSVETTFRIIECIKENDGARVTELSESLGIHKSTVVKHLNTLRGLRYVHKDDNEYRLGIPFADLGTVVTKDLTYSKRIEEAIDHLADRSGWIAGYAVKQQDFAFVIYLARDDGVEDIHVDRLQELHTSAAGKAILSQLSTDVREGLLEDRTLTERTQYTITDREALVEEIRHTNERGIAFDREELQEGLRIVALPFEDKQLRKPGAIFVAGSAEQLTGRWFEEDIPGLISSSIRKLDQQ